MSTTALASPTRHRSGFARRLRTSRL